MILLTVRGKTVDRFKKIFIAVITLSFTRIKTEGDIAKGVAIMNDHMFVETLIISSSFFAIAVILVASVLFLERKG